jgi:hypothetical protein
MDPIRNPFTPGAGTKPPQLAGRDVLLKRARLALGRLKAGRNARGQLFLGLRGVGKTVLLKAVERMAHAEGLLPVAVEVPEDQRLAQCLAPVLRTALYDLSRTAKARQLAEKSLAVLGQFARVFKVNLATGELSVHPDSVRGIADSGDLETDLPALCLQVAEAAAAAERPVVLLIDELQYLSVVDLRALIVAMHKVTQAGLPLVLFGAGLPQLAALAGSAKSYAERLFEYPEVGPLDAQGAHDAILLPVLDAGAEITREALDVIVTRTAGYPYFLQEWGQHTWDVAAGPRIDVPDVDEASPLTLADLDSGFFRVRFDRLTQAEREYLRAMAALGAGPHRSGQIAERLGAKVSAVGTLRATLIDKGMIYSPKHGDTAFTVPMFDDFMRRTMPRWKAERGMRKRGTLGP